MVAAAGGGVKSPPLLQSVYNVATEAQREGDKMEPRDNILRLSWRTLCGKETHTMMTVVALAICLALLSIGGRRA